MADNFSLTKYFRNQYLKEAISRDNSTYVTPTTGIKKSTAEYATDTKKSNAQLTTKAMRNPNFKAYDKDGEQPYLKEFQQPKSFDPDTIRLVREMLEVADIYHNDLVGGYDEPSSYLDKRTGGTIIKIPHFNGPKGRGALFGKETTDQIDRSKAAAKTVAAKLYYKFKDYIEDYEISDSSPAGVYGNIYLWMMFNDLAEDYTAPKGGTISSQFENINDPVLMRARAAKEKKEKIKLTPKPKKMRISSKAAELVDGFELEDLQRNLKDIYREMEQDAEPEGGPIADQFADEIDAHEQAIRFIKNKGKERAQMTYNQAIAMDEGSCGYTPDGKPRNKPAGPDLMELKEKIFNSLKK